MIRFPPSPGDQRLLLIRYHFKTMPVYYDKYGVPDHTRYFHKIGKPSTCTDNCSRGKRALRGAATARDFRVAALP